MSRYLNPYTDFGFKKLFGEEANKDLLQDFLNQLLPPQHQIAHLEFRTIEQLPDISIERRAFFDIHCLSATGERFVVEMQRTKMEFFKDRALYYVTFPIREQAKKGNWLFCLDPIYFVAILACEYDEAPMRKFRRDVALRDQDGDLFSDKLHFRFLQMPLFTKQAHELVTRFDKWMYFLKYLADFDDIPTILNEPVFNKAFRTAELANLSREQFTVYEKNLLEYRELNSVIDTAHKEGIAEGLAKGLEEGLAKGLEEGLAKGMEKGLVEGEKKGQVQLIMAMHRRGLDVPQIVDFTGIDIEFVRAILQK
ncbi:hypothetical protein TI04_01105 [Achromatium sp. WMS2]|nr:hypothetical protein TI04_01105 [Achromatium sp. WMS2]